MSGDHIPFHKMSDLCDNEIRACEERDSLMEHIQSCPECALEFRRLGKTLDLCRELSCISCPEHDLPARTMRSIRSARKKKLLLKSMPAMAASLLIIAGVSLFNAGIIGVHDRATVADDSSRKSFSDSERVIEIIRDHSAAISQVTDEYVEGTVPLSSFNNLRKHLGSRRVAYLLVEESDPDSGAQWGNAIEEVGLDDGQSAGNREPIPGGHGAAAQYVRFRVFR
ncbi:MAG: hypothetical protein A2176_03725 [Spirochaetes bacterium RBG_13_51_14]|nr:MAG: hypothetical protein A2176_03725 [Spirochaetes bacterium RBG_13_51_14]